MNSLVNSIHNLKIKNDNSIEVGLDIGGSLTKVAVSIKKDFMCQDIINKLKEEIQFLDQIELEENIILIILIQTTNFGTEGRDLLKKINQIQPLGKINATGGGAHKYSSLISNELNLIFDKQDELLSLVKGYILMSDYSTLYELNEKSDNISKTKINSEDSTNRRSITTVGLKYPHIAVNIGSGVSILLVNSVEDIKRVGGTMMGGGTLIGLSKLLINVDNYNDIMKLAEEGDNFNVDLLVKDIYSTSKQSTSTSLESDVIASSFGKIHQYIQTNQKDKIKKEDIAKSLLVMICYHITQMAVLIAQSHNVKNVYYFGNFSRRNSYAIEWLDYATKYWSKDLQICFNLFDGFLAAIGSFVN